MKHTLLWLLAVATLPAWADESGRAVSLNSAYKLECGSCHTPFPPGLLSAADWKATMAGLDKHFGSDASLDPKTFSEIRAWLGHHAGRRITSGANPPRVTTTRWFKREHRSIPAKSWQDNRIKSPTNCVACHKGADLGRFGEHEIDIPGVGRWEDD